MSKYLFVTAATALINLVLVTTNTIQIANASMDTGSSLAVTSQDKLIVKGEKPTQKPAHLNSQQQSDVKGIHRTLTEFYRGLNEYNVDRMARVAVTTSNNEKAYMQRIFDKLKAYNVDMSIEVQDIELISLSDHNAIVKVTQLMRARGSGRAMSSQQSSSFSLVKNQGRWRVIDSNTVMSSMPQNR
jgi:ketosteroid isomerase-like protein